MTAHLKNDKLTDIAKQIFGEELIDSVYIEELNLKDAIEVSEIYNERNQNENELSYDRDTICIKFIKGNIVQFTNSEWASMKKINELNLIEDEIVNEEKIDYRKFLEKKELYEYTKSLYNKSKPV